MNAHLSQYKRRWRKRRFLPRKWSGGGGRHYDVIRCSISIDASSHSQHGRWPYPTRRFYILLRILVVTAEAHYLFPVASSVTINQRPTFCYQPSRRNHTRTSVTSSKLAHLNPPLQPSCFGRKKGWELPRTMEIIKVSVLPLFLPFTPLRHCSPLQQSLHLHSGQEQKESWLEELVNTNQIQLRLLYWHLNLALHFRLCKPFALTCCILAFLLGLLSSRYIRNEWVVRLTAMGPIIAVVVLCSELHLGAGRVVQEEEEGRG